MAMSEHGTDSSDERTEGDTQPLRIDFSLPNFGDHFPRFDFDLDRVESSMDHGDVESKTHKEMSTSSLVEWDGPQDPGDPFNLPRSRKWLLTINMSLLSLMATLSSSIFTATVSATAEYFHVSREVMILGTTLYLVGFSVGPFIFGPLSELYGRKRPLIGAFFVFCLFQIPVAVATDIQSVMIFRFFQGVFGSAPQSIVGGAIADVWNPHERGFALPAFAASLFVGPIMGPVVGSFITESHLGWRWTQWITLIVALPLWAFTSLTIPETYRPVLLARRAKRLRQETGDWALHATSEENEPTLREIGSKFLLRPMKMLFSEPILFLITLYIGFIFGIIYLTFEAFPISYHEERGWPPGIASLPFIAVLVGSLSACFLVVLTRNTTLAPDATRGIAQESRLVLMSLGGFTLPLGLIWFAWTSFPSITPWPQIIAGVPIGFGLMLITLQGLNYVIDCYTRYANSALAANTSVRFAFGAGFPLFATAMYNRLGVEWATTLLALLATLLLPVPILFYWYGSRLRAMSKYAPES